MWVIDTDEIHCLEQGVLNAAPETIVIRFRVTLSARSPRVTDSQVMERDVRNYGDGVDRGLEE